MRQTIVLVMADIALELDRLSAIVTGQLDNGVTHSGDILDGAATSLGQVARSVLLLRLAQYDQLQVSICGFAVIVWRELGPDWR